MKRYRVIAGNCQLKSSSSKKAIASYCEELLQGSHPNIGEIILQRWDGCEQFGDWKDCKNYGSPLGVGYMVSVDLLHRHGGNGYTHVKSVRESSTGGTLFVMENGQWLDRSEFTFC